MKTKNRLIHRTLMSIITLVAVLAVVVVNVTMSLLLGDDLTINMTKESFDEISTESKTLLKDIDPAENNFTIYFLADKDELQSPEMGYSNSSSNGSTSSLWGMKHIWDLAQTYARTYDYIKVETLHITRDQDKLEAFRSTAGTTFSKQDVIIDNYTKEHDSNGNELLDADGNPIMHHNFRICKRDSFYTTDTNTGYAFGFDGDLRFTSTILSLSGANPTVYFIGGHGEDIGDDTTLDASMVADYGNAQALRDLLFKAGFVTKKINLQTQYRELFADESARLLVIYGPKSDYVVNRGGVSEIDIIRKFLTYSDHHLMTFFADDAEAMPELEEYLWDYWGVRPSGSVVVDSGTNSITPDGKTYVAAYETDQYSIGVNLTSPFNELASRPAAVFKNSTVLELSDSFMQNNGLTDAMVTTIAGPVFLTPTSASAVNASGEHTANYENDAQDAVMALSYANRFTDDNREVSNYALFCGGTGFADAQYLESNAYCNSDLLFYSMRLMAKQVVPFEVDFKEVNGESLESVQTSDIVAWTVCLCTLVPVTMLVLGTAVFVKRRHS